MTHYAWPEIESFHNIRKYAKAHPEILKGETNNGIAYRAKVKLHGTNAGIQIQRDRIVAQSRTQVLTEGNDNSGFAKWVKENEEQWKKFPWSNVVVYGEWCGKGIQGGVAISGIDRKVFAVFAIKVMESELVMVDPDVIAPFLQAAGIKDTYVLPWYGSGVSIGWNWDADALQRTVEHINSMVNIVEQNDPWVEETFGVKGVGEGLVFYPYFNEQLRWEDMSNLMFKAKGEKHKNVKTAAPAQVNPETAASVDAFVEMVLTEARLEQGAVAVNPLSSLTEEIDRQVLLPLHDVKLIGKFIAWVSADVAKETQDELEVSGLTMKQVQGPLTVKARTWYLEKTKQL